MPSAPLRPCSRGCGELVERGPCASCGKRQKAQHSRFYVFEGRNLYKTARWQALRLEQLAKDPFCIDCLAEGLVRDATDVDHDPPHRGDEQAFFDRKRLRSRCHRHHSLKTAREVGFGRRRSDRP